MVTLGFLKARSGLPLLALLCSTEKYVEQEDVKNYLFSPPKKSTSFSLECCKLQKMIVQYKYKSVL